MILQEVRENGKAIKRLNQKLDNLINIVSGEKIDDIHYTFPASKLMELLGIEDSIKVKQQYDALVCSKFLFYLFNDIHI